MFSGGPNSYPYGSYMAAPASASAVYGVPSYSLPPPSAVPPPVGVPPVYQPVPGVSGTVGTTSWKEPAPAATSTNRPRERISTDTSSKDPEDLKSRIFVGNVNSAGTTREDVIEICRPFGRLKAVAMFKGYAFVQYSSADEAELAVQGLNGYSYKGAKLDVRVVSVGRALTSAKKADNRTVMRPKNDFLFGGIKVKPDVANTRNRGFVYDLHRELPSLSFFDHGQKDMLMCGSCRTVFDQIPDYVQHRRRSSCNVFEEELCPTSLTCFTCSEQFKDTWVFLQHLVHRHCINMYKGQPKSDPIWFLQTFGEGERAASEDGESDSGEAEDKDAEKPQKAAEGAAADASAAELARNVLQESAEPPEKRMRAESWLADSDLRGHSRSASRHELDSADASNCSSDLGGAGAGGGVVGALPAVAQPPPFATSFLTMPPSFVAVPPPNYVAPVSAPHFSGAAPLAGSAQLSEAEQLKMLEEFR